MNHDIGFLHTATAHKKTFNTLMKKFAPELLVHHEVNEHLLEQARTLGLSPSVKKSINQAMHSAASGGAQLIVCTCSTIGGIAECMGKQSNFCTMRIDRAMADQAVNRGGKILIAAALESTLIPTRLLLDESINRQNRHCEIETLYIEDAWVHFKNSAMDNYFERIHGALSTVWQNYDVIVLAQASMAAAALLCHDIDIPVLSSPEPGVQAAIIRLEQLRNVRG